MEDHNNRIPRTLPVLHINNVVMFPYLLMPLVVSDDESKLVIDHALSQDKTMAFFLEKDKTEPNDIGLYEIGTSVTILRMLRNQDGSISLLLQGTSRIRMQKVVQREPFIMVDVESIVESSVEDTEIHAYRTIAVELMEKIAQESTVLNAEMIAGLNSIKQAGRVADIIAGNLELQTEDRQIILEAIDLKRRFKHLNNCLAEMIKQMRVENHIRSNIQLEMTEDQRRYYLREQMDAIRKELGESDEVSKEILKWKELITKNKLPDYVEEVALEELERLSSMQPAASEYAVIRNYLDWIVNLPWNKHSKDRLELPRIERILTQDHYGLEKPKERILEFIAVKKLKGRIKGPILCFVGPPGTGKTSIGKSVARALNRKFIRLSLGGIHDEAEIRGHRRTYIGAMPGKIIMEIKRQGTANPVFMLDEIDKLGRDFRGDPASALLEVLDPEQNNSFIDNYINLPFDLSEVMFITTANSLDTIPRALRDRMEIIEFTSYLEHDKIQIAKRYLVPREKEANGLKDQKITIKKSALEELIRYYVREAGVRNLQRRIGSIFRKIAKKVASGETEEIALGARDIKEYLGPRKYTLELANRKPEIGVATGLAWTMYGGELLFCEATRMPGKGAIQLTGLLGEVMKESARIALSYLKANSGRYNINPKDLEKYDIHVHFPAGAVPKDGPSAGITLTVVLASLFTQRKVRHDIAMTGEVTLTGKVLGIGGLKEKILAAKRAGIRNLIIPRENEETLSEISADILEDMNIMFVDKIKDVFSLVFLPETEPKKKTGKTASPSGDKA
ncbi:MAG TPA: endopeptidase La [Candidatus Cloacimonadota bacterium]|jgi:ATP-dependent Lon protease|nr:endopeptidase La [Candidatus Cloacimonadota bacterium]HOF59647.1 endopeptidase La [Candidatus Cloacimonadota bacterium]HOR58922.1 endopeptidase La [Candidatus Cloacimonadota bacterium]HPB09101.1 endopeptidase La [Candidatus Cloacimonadota bacterium]HPL23151.1 endopeptidase La [Candidatus Cloacimonadota bacterium]